MIFLSNFFYGSALLIILFLACLITVVGIKTVYLIIKNKWYKPVYQEKPKQKRPVSRQHKIRSLEIDPDQFDKISFRKN